MSFFDLCKLKFNEINKAILKLEDKIDVITEGWKDTVLNKLKAFIIELRKDKKKMYTFIIQIIFFISYTGLFFWLLERANFHSYLDKMVPASHYMVSTILINLGPIVYSLLMILYSCMVYFSFNIKFKDKIQYLMISYFLIFMYYILKISRITIPNEKNEYFYFLNFNQHFNIFSYYIKNYYSIYIFYLLIIIVFISSYMMIQKTPFIKISNNKYLKYIIALYLIFMIAFTIITENKILVSISLINTIIILECFTLLTIYLTVRNNINIITNIITYFFYSVFGYILYMFGTSLYMYVFGTDLINILYYHYNILNFETNIKYSYIIKLSNFLFFISFALKLYLFPFSNIIDKLYNAIDIYEIIIISFLIVPIIYILFMQFLGTIGWFNQSNIIDDLSVKIAIMFISIITFIYSITISIDKNNLKSLIAYSSINTSSFFILLNTISFYILIEWWSYFFLYQIVYLLNILLFIFLLIASNKKNIKQYDFLSISINMSYDKIKYIVIILFILSITMVMPPIFFLKLEMIVSFLYLNYVDTLHYFYFIYMLIIILYSISSYILYIRIFTFFKINNINERKNQNISKNNKMLKKYYNIK